MFLGSLPLCVERVFVAVLGDVFGDEFGDVLGRCLGGIS